MSKSAAGKAKDGVKVLARNKKARHEFFIEETIEAGIVPGPRISSGAYALWTSLLRRYAALRYGGLGLDDELRLDVERYLADGAR